MQIYHANRCRYDKEKSDRTTFSNTAHSAVQKHKKEQSPAGRHKIINSVILSTVLRTRYQVDSATALRAVLYCIVLRTTFKISCFLYHPITQAFFHL